jgi:hypothetical protein
MANTDVVISDEFDMRVPSVSQVAVNVGDSVTFTVNEGADSALYFPTQTAAILSPEPGARVDLVFGATLTYTFTSAECGAYGVVVQAPEVSAPTSFDFNIPTDTPVFVIQPGLQIGFGGPSNTPLG